MNRRQFLGTTLAASYGGSLLGEEAGPSKPPYRVLYSNDTTNVSGCISPFHKAGEPLRLPMLEASVDEVTGLVDAHLLQPGLGMVPMWPSKVLPLEEHYRWLKERYGQEPDSFGRVVLNGGDIVKTFVDRCRLRGQAPFISFRLNDAHHKEFADAKRGEKIGNLGMSVTRFYEEHPEYHIVPGSKRGADLVQNWAVSEVRESKFALIRELCENYDLDGLELDFMRFYSFFPAEVPVEQRRGIMTGFVKKVRELLDRTLRQGKRRWLCARIPCYLKAFDPLGIDLPAMVTAGLDMINVSASYFTVQQTDLPTMRRMAPGASVYHELCHSIWNGEKLTAGYDTFAFRRATPEQMQTAAHLAYARDGGGVSLFNFAYYREHGGPGRGPFTEPPFEILKHLRDAKWLAQQPQHWFLAPGWNNPFIRPPLLPRKVKADSTTKFQLDLAPPANGWEKHGRLRIQLETPPSAESQWTARLNGTELAPSNDVSEPFPNPYPSMLGKPEQMRAWTVPETVPRAGFNTLELSLKSGGDATLDYLDLFLP